MNSHRLLAGICLALLPFTANAIPVTYEFSGQMAEYGYSTPDDGSILDPMIPLPAEFSGFFTYDNETPVGYQVPGIVGYYGAITGATISFGPGGSLGVFNFANQPYAAYTSQVSVISFVNDLEFNGNPPYDQFNLIAALGNAPGDPANMYRYLSFSTSDYSGQQIPTGQTLLDPLPVDAFLSGSHSLSFGYGLYDEAGESTDGAYIASRQITLALAPTAVPEPGTAPLLGLGLAGFWMAMRRRAGQAQRPN